MCKRIASWQGGTMAICGKWSQAIACLGVAWAIEQLSERCRDDQMARAGGTWYSDGW